MSHAQQDALITPTPVGQFDPEQIWEDLRAEAAQVAKRETALEAYLTRCILRHDRFADSLSCVLSNELAAAHLSAETVYGFIQDGIAADPSILDAALEDLSAHVDRDPASVGYLTPFLYFKGFHALQAHRIAHWLYNQDRKALAYYLQARTSQEYDVDIHPAARMGKGIMIDHASGVVIGETAVVENNVSMLHGVTLGGTGKESGDRHPKIRSCVLLGAGARILGNIEVGVGAKVGGQ